MIASRSKRFAIKWLTLSRHFNRLFLLQIFTRCTILVSPACPLLVSIFISLSLTASLLNFQGTSTVWRFWWRKDDRWNHFWKHFSLSIHILYLSLISSFQHFIALSFHKDQSNVKMIIFVSARTNCSKIYNERFSRKSLVQSLVHLCRQNFTLARSPVGNPIVCLSINSKMKFGVEPHWSLIFSQL